MKALTPTLLRQAMQKLGYAWHDDSPNLIGIRTTLTVPDLFNDLLVCCWHQPAMPAGLSLLKQQEFLAGWLYTGKDGKAIKPDGVPGPNTTFALQQLAATAGTDRLKAWIITTTPGNFYLQQPLSKAGCAVLMPGQYKGAYQLGFHQNKPAHPALVQVGAKVRAYRDNDRDIYAEETKVIEEGFFGINIHRSNMVGATPRIANWSAGCQVFQRKTDHDELLRLCEHFRADCKNCYTYTLLRERELG
ncbi:MAG: hypothetical protein ACRYFZ_11005 [Janthinobacterium lividum]